MTLRELMGNGAPEVEVSGLAYSSQSVTDGTLFFCVPGFRADGHDFAPEAVERGAVALVSQRPLGLGVPELVVPDVRAAMGPAAARFYGDPTDALEVVGITGTNGKTTTAFLVRHLLEAAGRSTGLLGTVKRVVGGVEEEVERTTPEAIDLQATFRRMLDAGDTACAMEVSSHALELGRVAGIRFACRVFTNLTQDHLDFHPSMEDYFAAKRRLFEGPGPAVVNLDDPWGRRLADDAEAIGFAVESEADYRARDVRFDLTGSSFTCESPEGSRELRSPLPGLFNVQNVLAAVAAARSLGVPMDVIADALPAFGRVPGRFEPVDEGQDFGLLVDYAHTPDSLENVLRAARAITNGRLVAVFGAGGDRDRSKRPLMGDAARRLADRVIVTSDNPRSEDPEQIIDEVMAGAGAGAEREVDRRRAIAMAVESAAPGDVVVVAGKGHEQGQEFEDGRKEPFDDVTVAREALRSRAGGGPVIDLAPARLAEAAGARLAGGDPEGPGPRRVVVDSRDLGPGDLFVGLPGERVHGGEFATAAIEAGAWGVLVDPGHAPDAGTALVADDPLAALGELARSWRRELGCRVVGITGSTGKTSTKDILAALLAPQVRTHANRENLNTEIGLPLSLLEAPRGTEVAVLEMAMRGEGQIAELAAIAEPDVGVIVNVGPVHLEILGTVERVAAAKAELIRDLRPGAACVLPASEPLLDAHRRSDLDTWTFGPAGEVMLLAMTGDHAEIEARGRRIELELPYSEPHNLLNTLAAVAAAESLGVAVGGRVDVRFSSLRGELVELPGGVVVVNDCYNANPMSMRAALDHLADSPADRRIAVLGTMAELGDDSPGYHREIGEHAAARGIDVLVPVGREALAYLDGFHGEAHPVAGPEEAGALLEEVARPGDRVLVKGSRSAGLERVLA